MKTTLTKVVTLGSLCALLAGTAATAFAQDNGHRDQNGDQGQYRQHQFDQHQDGDYRHSDQYRHANQNERRRLDRLHATYARATSHGNYGVAERAHEHAQAIRAQIHSQHQDNRQHGDHQNDY